MINLITLLLMLVSYFVGTFVYVKFESLLLGVLSFLIVQLSYVYFMFYM